MKGDVDAAIQFIRMADISANEELMFWWIEIPRITLCRVLIAEGTDEKINEAIIKLNGYYDENDKVHNRYQKIGIKLLLAIAYHKLGEKTTAIKNLTACIEMGNLGGWIFPFIEYVEPMMELLPLVLSSSENNTHYIEKILKELEKNSGFRKSDPTMDVDKKALPNSESTSMREQEILESVRTNDRSDTLSFRELEVLELVGSGLRNKEISEKLFVQTSTIKQHMKNIFTKLDVHNRVMAVNRAEELNLINKG